MAHVNDINCQWCGLTLWVDDGPAGLWEDWPWSEARQLRSPNPLHRICPKKPPTTAEEGAAVAFGLMGMAEAIRSNLWETVNVVPPRGDTETTILDLKRPMCGSGYHPYPCPGCGGTGWVLESRSTGHDP